MRVWLIGRYLTTEEIDGADGANWAVEGIFTTRTRALDHAELKEGWFIAELPLDEPCPPGALELPGFEWLFDYEEAST